MTRLCVRSCEKRLLIYTSFTLHVDPAIGFISIIGIAHLYVGVQCNADLGEMHRTTSNDTRAHTIRNLLRFRQILVGAGCVDAICWIDHAIKRRSVLAVASV